MVAVSGHPNPTYLHHAVILPAAGSKRNLQGGGAEKRTGVDREMHSRGAGDGETHKFD